ncbi:MAG TPA: VCBS repeat-containing protein, partial [Pyrinomonadaceae bacterium]
MKSLWVLLACGLLAVCSCARAFGQARPVFDASGLGCSFDGAAATRSFSWPHTIGGGQSRLLVVGVSTTTLDIVPVGSPLPRVVSVSYNGLALTRINDLPAVSPLPDTRAGVEMFRLSEPLPASGTYMLTVTLNAGADYAVGGSVSFSDVNQVRPLGLFQSSGGNSRSPNINVLSAPNEVLLDTVATRFDGGVLQPQAAQAERWNGRNCFDLIHSIGAGSSKQGAFFATTLDWMMVGGNSQPQPWAIGAVSIKPVPTRLSDFDGDGRTDVAIWRPSSGNWYLNTSSLAPRVQFDWGQASLGDIAVPGDYDGDRRADIAVWRAGVEMFRLSEPLPASGTYMLTVTLNAGADYAVGG